MHNMCLVGTPVNYGRIYLSAVGDMVLKRSRHVREVLLVLFQNHVSDRPRYAEKVIVCVWFLSKWIFLVV